MVRSYAYTFCIFIFIVLGTFEPVHAKMEWASTDQSETGSTIADTAGEPALILFDRGKINVGFPWEEKVTVERYTRVRIQNEAGYRFANIRLIYHEQQKIKDLEARAILPDGRIVELEKKDFLRNRIKIGSGGELFEITFAFPAVEPGCIVEHKYTRESKNAAFLDKWYFQNEIPTLHSEISAEVPSFYAYNCYLYPPGLISMPEGKNLDFIESGQHLRKGLFTWSLDNIPKVVSEPFSPPADAIRYQIFFAISALIVPQPGGPPQRISYYDSWPNAAKAFQGVFSWIKDSEEVKAAAKGCAGPDLSREAKIRAVFNYIRNHCTYRKGSDFEVFISEPRETLKQREGDTGDLSALMIQMLRDLDVEAHPAVILTRYDPPFLKNFPSPTQFTKMIVYAPGPEDTLWINPAGSMTDHCLLPWYDQGQVALILNTQSGNFAQTPIYKAELNTVRHEAAMTVTEEGAVEVEGRAVLRGLCADECIGAVKDLPAEDRRKYFREKFCLFADNTELTALELPEDLKGVRDSLCLEYRAVAKDGAQAVGERLLLSPLVGHKCSAQSFETVKRSHPISFTYPYSVECTVRITSPAGYKLDSELSKADIDRPYGSYSRRVGQSGEELTFQRRFTLARPHYPVTDYPEIREHYRQLATWDDERIVLIKTGTASDQKQ